MVLNIFLDYFLKCQVIVDLMHQFLAGIKVCGNLHIICLLVNNGQHNYIVVFLLVYS